MLRFFCVLLTALPLSAMTYEMIRDEHLAEDAGAIVVGRIVSVETDTATRYTLDVERVLQGRPCHPEQSEGPSLAPHTEGPSPSSRLRMTPPPCCESEIAPRVVVRLPGGRNVRVHGVPRFEAGDRLLLFLMPNRDGTFSPLHLALGAFRDDGGVAVRELGADDDAARDFSRFADWLADRTRAAGYRLLAPRVASHFSFLQFDNLHLRWLEFQRDATVRWHIDEHSEIALRAMRVWNDDPESVVAFELAGAGATKAGLTFDDGRNSILFGDPNEELPGRYRCGRGGAMALAGSWLRESERFLFQGAQVVPIAGADVIVNDGIECHLATSDLPIEEALTHELGHTLGLGHACGEKHFCNEPAQDQAVMRAAVHFDGRGGRLSTDDTTALRALYTREGPILGFTAVTRGRRVELTPTRTLPVVYEWDFGDGSAISTELAPAHVYERPGQYTVRLRAADDTGTNEIVQTVVIAGTKRRAAR